MRGFAFIVAMLWAGVSYAAPFTPCPLITIGWALQGPPPITAVLYAQSYELLYVIFNNTIASAYSNVPTSVMQTFSQSSNYLNTYNLIVKPSYHSTLLQEVNNCPFHFEPNGPYIWTQ